MHESDDFVDSWQFRTLMAGAFIAAFGIAVCLIGTYSRSESLCAASVTGHVQTACSWRCGNAG